MKKIFSLLVLAFATSVVSSQITADAISVSNMNTFLATQNVQQMAEDGDTIWLATTGGLVKFSKSQGKPIAFYNTSNSDIPTNYLTSIAIDKQGNPLIGSSFGLIKFNGTSCQIFTMSDTGLGSNSIYAVAVDTAGNIWIGNLYGGAMFDGSEWHLTEDMGYSMPIDHIIADKQGNVWFTNQGHTIVKYSGQQWTTYTYQDMGIPEVTAWPHIDVDEDGILWVITHIGLVRFDGLTWTQYPLEFYGLSFYASIACGPDGLVWCWYDTDRVYVFDGTGWTSHYIEVLPVSDYPNDIYVSDDGVLWFGANNGFYNLANENITTFPVSNVGFQSNLIFDIAIDSNGKKWITDGTLYAYDTAWEQHESDEDTFERLAIDLESDIWLGGFWGIYKYDNDFEHIVDTWGGNSIAIGPSNEKWFGTGFIYGYGGTLVRYTDTSMTTYDRDNSIVSGPVENVAVAPDGTVWFENNRLKSFDGQEWAAYDIPNPYFSISCIAISMDGMIYIGNNSGGYAIFNGYSWAYVDSTNSPLADDRIRCLKFDQLGMLWIGTDKSGLYCTDGTQWWVLNMENSSLPDNKIYDIEFEGEIRWLATSSGLVSFEGIGLLLPSREHALEEQLSIYPNPVKETIHLSIPEGSYQASVFNMQGVVVKSSLVTTGSLDVSTIPAGIYYLRVTSEKGSWGAKFIRQ